MFMGTFHKEDTYLVLQTTGVCIPLCHLLLRNLKVMSSFKKLLKAYDVENPGVGITAMQMNCIVSTLKNLTDKYKET